MLLVNSLLTGVKKVKHDSDPVPVLPDVNNLEHEVETEAIVEPPLPTSIEQDLPTTIEQELDTTHSNEPAAIAEDSSKVVLDADATGAIERQSELEETLTPSAQETEVDTVSSTKDTLTAVVAHEVENEAEATATTTNDLAAEFPETEQPVISTIEVFIFISVETCWLTRITSIG